MKEKITLKWVKNSTNYHHLQGEESITHARVIMDDDYDDDDLTIKSVINTSPNKHVIITWNKEHIKVKHQLICATHKIISYSKKRGEGK